MDMELQNFTKDRKLRWQCIKAELLKTWSAVSENELNRTGGQPKKIAALVKRKCGDDETKFKSIYSEILMEIDTECSISYAE